MTTQRYTKTVTYKKFIKLCEGKFLPENCISARPIRFFGKVFFMELWMRENNPTPTIKDYLTSPLAVAIYTTATLAFLSYKLTELIPCINAPYC